MATLSQILTKKWPGIEWRMSGEDYSTLTWMSPTTKPTEQQILSFSAEVDTILAAEEVANRQAKLLSQSDNILQAFEVIANAIDDLQTKANINNTHSTRIDTLRTKLANIRNQ